MPNNSSSRVSRKASGTTIAAFLGICLTFTGAPKAAAALYANGTNYSVGSAPVGVWLGNLRGTGNSRDLVVANSGANTVGVRLCLDNGTFGQLINYSVGLNPVAVRTGNLNGDKYEDVVVANNGTNTVSVLINQGFGANFQAATNFVVGSSANPGPQAVTVADANLDGKVDLLVANYNDNSISVLLGLGGGVFGQCTNFSVGTGPKSIYAADFTGDNIVDVLTADYDGDTLTILPGVGNGSFGTAQTITLPEHSHPSYALPADFNQDGNLDIAATMQGSNMVRVLHYFAGDYNLAADYTVGAGPRSLVLRDLNRDGYADMAVAESGDDDLRVLLGSITGAFTDVGTFPVGDNPAIVVGSNFNSDEAGDLAVANSGSDTVSVLLFAGPLAYNVTVSVLEDTPKAVPLNGKILGGGTLIYITNSLPTHGTLSGPTTNLIYLPETNYFGADSFQYSTSDGTLTSAVATVTLNVTPVNDAPSFALVTNFVSVKEDALTTNIVGFATSMFAGTNESSQTLAFVVATTNAAFFASQPAISSIGKLTFRPKLNATGSQTLSVRLRDSGGYLNGGTNLSPAQYFTVEVTPNPIKPVGGTYSGLFYETNGVWHQTSGYITFTMKNSGTFSGKITAEGIRYSFSGLFDESGHAQTEVLRNNTTLTVDLQLDLTNHTDKVTGTVGDGVWSAPLVGDRVIFNSVTNPAAQAGSYTMVIPGNPTNSMDSPGGDGYATMTINAAGAVRLSGKVGDAVSFSHSTYLSKAGQFPLYAPLYSTRGSMLSWVTITNTLTNSIEGDLSWIRTSFANRYYPNGFTNQVALLGSTYTSPPPNERVLDLIGGFLTFGGGNLGSPVVYAAVLTDTNTVYSGNVQYLRLSSSASGLVAGQFLHPGLGVNRALIGVVLQQQNVMRGQFSGYDQTGSMLFAP